MNYPSEANYYLSEHVALLHNSYRKLLAQPLIPGVMSQEAVAQAIFYAPFVIVSHGTESDPVFNYANLRALELFEFSWEEFTSLPSRLSAKPAQQAEREKLLADVNLLGYSENYQGIRITKGGRRFMIKNAVVWNVLDDKGRYAGQAAKFEELEFL